MTNAERRCSRTGSEPSKLSRDDWLNAARKALASHGVEGVSIQAIAKELGVTKGSFYWHFRDREHLCDEILTEWRQQCTIDLLEAAGSPLEPDQQLRRIAQIPFAPSDEEQIRLALGLQLWARTNPKVRAALDEIDDLRIRALTQLLAACGVEAGEARARSVLAYSYLRAAMWQAHRDDHELLGQCQAVLFAGTPLRQ